MLILKGKPKEGSLIRFIQFKLISFNDEDLVSISSLIKFIIEKLVIRINTDGKKTPGEYVEYVHTGGTWGDAADQCKMNFKYLNY